MVQETKNKVWLKKSHFEVILREASKWYPSETGGVLIGYWGSEHEVVITNIVGPGVKAIHKKSSFSPDNDFHNKEIERIYAESCRTETYLGDWHTHPKAKAYLSSIDKGTLKCIANYRQARLNKPLMMILGTDPIELRIWIHQSQYVGRYKKTCIKQCKIIFF